MGTYLFVLVIHHRCEYILIIVQIETEVNIEVVKRTVVTERIDALFIDSSAIKSYSVSSARITSMRLMGDFTDHQYSEIHSYPSEVLIATSM